MWRAGRNALSRGMPYTKNAQAWRLSTEDRTALELAGVDASQASELKDEERFMVLADARTQRKMAEQVTRNRCAQCWFHADDCICSQFVRLKFRLDVRFLIYMHYIELFNAGNDAKILLSAAGEATELFVYGRKGDDEKLRDRVHGNEQTTVLLYPSDDAFSVEQIRPSLLPAAKQKPIQIIVVDGTWRQVRTMLKHFQKTISKEVRLIKLSPTALSVYARTQTEPGRISTIEAIALLVQELGEDPDVCSSIISYLQINNQNVDKGKCRPAERPAKKQRRERVKAQRIAEEKV